MRCYRCKSHVRKVNFLSKHCVEVHVRVLVLFLTLQNRPASFCQCNSLVRYENVITMYWTNSTDGAVEQVASKINYIKAKPNFSPPPKSTQKKITWTRESAMRDLMILQHVVALLVGKLCHPKNDFCQKWQGYSMFDKFAYRLYKIVIKVLKNVKLVPITMNDYSVRLTACRYKGVLPRVLSRCAVLYLSCAVPCWDKKIWSPYLDASLSKAFSAFFHLVVQLADIVLHVVLRNFPYIGLSWLSP